MRLKTLALVGATFVVGVAQAQDTTVDAGATLPASQVTIVGEVKYVRVDPEVTYIQLLTMDQQGNVIEWELERPTIDTRPHRPGEKTPAINVRDTLSVVVVPSSTLEPKGEVVSASRLEPLSPVQ